MKKNITSMAESSLRPAGFYKNYEVEVKRCINKLNKVVKLFKLQAVTTYLNRTIVELRLYRYAHKFFIFS